MVGRKCSFQFLLTNSISDWKIKLRTVLWRSGCYIFIILNLKRYLHFHKVEVLYYAMLPLDNETFKSCPRTYCVILMLSVERQNIPQYSTISETRLKLNQLPHEANLRRFRPFEYITFILLWKRAVWCLL